MYPSIFSKAMVAFKDIVGWRTKEMKIYPCDFYFIPFIYV
jgi:hypothetical protein